MLRGKGGKCHYSISASYLGLLQPCHSTNFTCKFCQYFLSTDHQFGRKDHVHVIAEAHVAWLAQWDRRRRSCRVCLCAGRSCLSRTRASLLLMLASRRPELTTFQWRHRRVLVYVAARLNELFLVNVDVARRSRRLRLGWEVCKQGDFGVGYGRPFHQLLCTSILWRRNTLKLQNVNGEPVYTYTN